MPEHLVADVPAQLAPYLRSLHGYEVAGEPPGTHLGLPSSTVTLVIDLQAPMRMDQPGQGVVVGHDVLGVADAAVVWGRAQALGAQVVRPLEESDYGSTGFTVADPEGNRWSFGTYAG